MFYVWDVNGIRRDYVQGMTPVGRRVEAITAVERARPGGKVARKESAEDLRERELAKKSYRQIAGEGGERQPAILAEQIMSAPVETLVQSATLAEAYQIVQQRRFRHVPVVGTAGELRGILSDRDLLRAMSEMQPEQFKSNPISEIMAKNVLSAHTNTRIRDLARVFFEERIGAMPIVDDQQHIVGIVTRSDVLRAVVQTAPLELWV